MSLARPRVLIAPGLCVILLAGARATHLSVAGPSPPSQSPPSKGIAPAAWINDLTPISERDWTYERASHLLERAGFGGTLQGAARRARSIPQRNCTCARFCFAWPD